jgi:L-asparaginase
MPRTSVALISTGGTIEKTYDDLKGVLSNEVSVLDVMLASLQLTGIKITRMRLMNKDSLEMTSGDHDLIAKTAGEMAEAHAGVVIVHGTDRLAVTGERLVATLSAPKVPVVLTGAMQPYVMRNTDAMQNLTEALLAVQLLDPGIYVVMHNRVLRFPGVVKDPDQGTFVRSGEIGR